MVHKHLQTAKAEDKVSLVIEMLIPNADTGISLSKRERIARSRTLTTVAKDRALQLFRNARLHVEGIDGSGHLVLTGPVAVLRQYLSDRGEVAKRTDLRILPNFQVTAAH